MRKLASLFFMFFYIYPILFINIPVTTRIAFSFIGFFMLCYSFLYKNIYVSKKYIYLSIILLLILLLSFLSVIVNETQDLEFIKYPFSFIAILFGAYALINILHVVNKSYIDFCFVAELIIGVVLIQSVIALVMYIIPDFYNLLISLQNISGAEYYKMSSLSDMRVIGFGSQYFGAGITNGFALIILAYLIRIGYYGNSIFKASIAYVVIFSVGIAMARTTFIGLGLSFILLLPFQSALKINIMLFKRNVKLICILFLIFVFGYGFVSALYPSATSRIEPLVNFALEMFLNYINKGQFTTESTSQLETMYVFPDNIYTYFIGDGLYTAVDGLYYMGTDVGYLRLLFYFGVVGVFLFIALQFALLIFSVPKSGDKSKFVCIVFIYIIVLNFKGFADLSSILALFFILNNSRVNDRNNIHNLVINKG